MYPIPGRWEEQVCACLSQLPSELRAKLGAHLLEFLGEVRERLFTSTISQARETGPQIRDAPCVEPRLARVRSCLLGVDRRLRVPTFLELVASV